MLGWKFYKIKKDIVKRKLLKKIKKSYKEASNPKTIRNYVMVKIINVKNDIFKNFKTQIWLQINPKSQISQNIKNSYKETYKKVRTIIIFVSENY